MIEMSKFYTMHRFLKTKKDTTRFLEDLTEAENNLFKYTADDTAPLAEFSQKYHKLLGDLNLDLTKKDSIIKNFNEIKQYFGSLDYMRISLAFSPSDRFFDRMQESLTKKIGFPPVFDVLVDPETYGGAIIDYNGRHTDMSLKKVLENYFTEHKDAILSGI
jgi:hypothetical protein